MGTPTHLRSSGVARPLESAAMTSPPAAAPPQAFDEEDGGGGGPSSRRGVPAMSPHVMTAGTVTPGMIAGV